MEMNDVVSAVNFLNAESSLNEGARKHVKIMRTAIARTGKAVDLIGFSAPKAIKNAFRGIDYAIVERLLAEHKLVMRFCPSPGQFEAVSSMDDVTAIIAAND